MCKSKSSQNLGLGHRLPLVTLGRVNKTSKSKLKMHNRYTNSQRVSESGSSSSSHSMHSLSRKQTRRLKKDALKRHVCVHLHRCDDPITTPKKTRPDNLKFRKSLSVASDVADSGLGSSVSVSPRSDIYSRWEEEFPLENPNESSRVIATTPDELPVPSSSQSAAILGQVQVNPRKDNKKKKQTCPRRRDKVLTALGLEPTKKKDGRGRPPKKRPSQSSEAHPGRSCLRPRIPDSSVDERVPISASPLEVASAEVGRLKIILQDHQRMVATSSQEIKRLKNEIKELETAFQQKSDEVNVLKEKVTSQKSILDFQDKLIRKVDLTAEQIDKLTSDPLDSGQMDSASFLEYLKTHNN